MSRRILVAVDGSKVSEAALKSALDLAKAWSAPVRVLHVIDSPYTYPEALYGELSTDVEALQRAWHRAGQTVLDRAVALAREASVGAEATLLDMNGRRITSVIVDRDGCVLDHRHPNADAREPAPSQVASPERLDRRVCGQFARGGAAAGVPCARLRPAPRPQPDGSLKGGRDPVRLDRRRRRRVASDSCVLDRKVVGSGTGRSC